MQLVQPVVTQSPINFVRSPRRKKHSKEVCHCNAYAFPHRAGGGVCEDPGPEPKSCGECKFGGVEYDPYGTGDRWFGLPTCEGCRWG